MTRNPAFAYLGKLAIKSFSLLKVAKQLFLFLQTLHATLSVQKFKNRLESIKLEDMFYIPTEGLYRI
jgi:hypothetical protein